MAFITRTILCVLMTVLCVLSLCCVQNCIASRTIRVKTGYNNNRDAVITGQTVSYRETDVDQYLGIEYARSGYSLRFSMPRPRNDLSSEFKAVEFGPACSQYTESPFPWYTNTADITERCLFMNIWVPSTASKYDKKAVMVWIHGGDHRYGSANHELYNGTLLAAEGDIIVITLNYRLGFFSYFTTNSRTAKGNLALDDIIEALLFIQKYIEEFGGDKSQITVAGQGSGAANVAWLSFARGAKDLFTRQIIQSPLAFFKQNTNEQNIAYSQKLAVLERCANDSYTIYDHPVEIVKCMKNRNDIRITYDDYELGSYPYLYPQWGDFDKFQKNPRDAMKKGDFHCNELLIGINQDEGSYLLTAYEYQDIFGFFGDKNAHVNRTLAEDIIRSVSTDQGLSDIDSIVSYYLPDDLKDDEDFKIRTQVVTALGNILHDCPAVYVAEKWSEKCGQTYFYFFNHRPIGSPWAKWMGVAHFDEVKFVFGRPIQETITRKNWRERYISAFMVLNWAEFVKTGTPDDYSWRKYDEKTRFHRYLNHTSIREDRSGENGPYFQNCKFLKPKFGF